jgi:hypothetical protein
MEVLVAAGVLAKEQLVAIPRPTEATNRSIGKVRQGFGFSTFHRLHPSVHYTIDRPAECEHRSVRADRDARPLRVPEEHFTRNKITHRNTLGGGSSQTNYFEKHGSFSFSID